MSQIKIRSFAIAAMLTLLAPFAVYAVDGGAEAPDIAPQMVATTAAVSSVGSDAPEEAPSLVDMIVGFFHAVAQGPSGPSGDDGNDYGVAPTSRGPGFDPVGTRSE